MLLEPPAGVGTPRHQDEPLGPGSGDGGRDQLGAYALAPERGRDLGVQKQESALIKLVEELRLFVSLSQDETFALPIVGDGLRSLGWAHSQMLRRRPELGVGPPLKGPDWSRHPARDKHHSVTPMDVLRQLPSVCPLESVRAPVRSGVGALFSSNRFPEERYDRPPGDPGLFGPDSVTWRVHADVSMFVGGITALMLQTLHPLAAAGVADHSRFREEPLERLSRTGSFVAATTYGATPVAESVIAAVRRVHDKVSGVTPDGQPYAANDPHLLRWVHVAEVTSFVRAHRRYCPFPVRGADIDRYYAEMAIVAHKLGATEVPASRAEIHRYLTEVRPQLSAGPQARDLFWFISHPVDRGSVDQGGAHVAHPGVYRPAAGLGPRAAFGAAADSRRHRHPGDHLQRAAGPAPGPRVVADPRSGP